MTTVIETDILGIKRYIRGKVRDVYDLGDTLLLVATDRISAFDVIMPNGIPDKGAVLTQLSRYWFLNIRPLVSTHYITTNIDYICERIQEAGGTITESLQQTLTNRAMLGVKTSAYPVECVVRGYIAGSLWKEYVEAGGQRKDLVLHGHSLPGGLKESEQLPQPIFTPATKASSGHDINISRAEMANIVGAELAYQLEQTSLAIYTLASQRAAQRGILLADTKFEFGSHAGTLTLIDEALTPDSSRFWDAAIYEPGKAQPSYDKQFVRDWLIALGWDKEPPAPLLPDDIVAKTAEKYSTAFQLLTGRALGQL